MKISSLIIPSLVVLVFLSACEEESRPRRQRTTTVETGGNSYGYAPTAGTATDFVTDTTTESTTTTGTETTTTVQEDTTLIQANPTPTPAPETTVDTSATTQRNLPYGTPVAGKAGFVTSPYAPYAGYVDVRGFPPNTEVKDPYSGKIFLVP